MLVRRRVVTEVVVAVMVRGAGVATAARRVIVAVVVM